jgi:hypothetical protein
MELDCFSIKHRDAAISHAYNFLRKRGLFPIDNDDSDDEDYIFGDDDFPSAEDEEVVVVDTYDLLEPIAERLTCEKMEKTMKKVNKEGGKRGVEIEGAADMGGLQFFCTQMDLPGANVDMLVESMRNMNAKSDPSAEERTGGAGRIGKTILSMTDDKLCMVAYVPEDKTAECSASEWLLNTVTNILKTGHDKETAAEDAKALVSSYAGNEKTFAKAVIDKNGAKGLFPLKMKDECINTAYAYLKARGLFPDGADDSDDDYVFGDEDFPDF